MDEFSDVSQRLIHHPNTYDQPKTSTQHVFEGLGPGTVAVEDCRVLHDEEEAPKSVIVAAAINRLRSRNIRTSVSPIPLFPAQGAHALTAYELSQVLRHQSSAHSHPSSSSEVARSQGLRDQGFNPVQRSELPAAQLPASNTMFQSARGVDIGNGATFMNAGGNNVINNNYGGTHGLEKMESFVSFSAQYDSSAQDPEGQCHPGTRGNVLKRIRDWVDNPNAPERIFWLHGPAGAGKSAIAQTIAHSYDRSKVVATFFFYKSDDSRNDGNRLFTTLAYQLAFSIPAVKDYMVQSLEERPDLPRTNIEIQFDRLICRPFRALNEAASQQLCPANTVHAMYNYRQLFPVVIIDGVDECTDEKIQQRFLKVIGNAIRDNHFLLRFLICSRPEAHIEEIIKRFQPAILNVNLAELDDANRDIEKYLVDEFSRIAYKQELDPTWPGREIIHEIVHKSSGYFIYAATIIKFVSDEDNSAESQLAFIRSIRPSKAISPFATLDELYLEILRRQPDQEFLKRFLVLLVARISASSHGDLHKDDAVLMHVSEKELHIKLRKMRSLLKFEPYIGLHHQSFLDFLQTPSRSSEYYVGEQDGTSLYFYVFIDSLVRYVSIVIERPDYHDTCHFCPGFGNYICAEPREFWQFVPQWQKSLEPLLHLWDRLLEFPNFVSPWKFLPCDKCNVSNVMRDLLLQVAFHQSATSLSSYEEAESAMNSSEGEPRVVARMGQTETAQSVFKEDLDTCLSSLIHVLVAELGQPTAVVINHMYSVLRFDPAAIAMRVRSVSNAQNLIDLISYMNENNVLSRHMVRKASQLALKIFARVPILPQSLALRSNNIPPQRLYDHGVTDFQLLCQTAFAGKILDHCYVVPVLTISEDEGYFGLVHSHDIDSEGLIMEWRSRSRPSPVITFQVMLRIARTLQYLHTMDVVLHLFGPDDVFVDSKLHPRILCVYAISHDPPDKRGREGFLYEDNIYCFGLLFYQVYFNIHINPWRPFIITERPYKPEIPEHVWQFIQHCCAADSKSRPTAEEVVQNMESWRLE